MKKILVPVFCFLALVAAKSQQWPAILEPVFRPDTFNIVSFGAKADGMTINTKPILAAIDACYKAGGGTVLIPSGFWLTGPIRLQSNINLHVAKGAVLQFSDNTGEYPLIETNWEGVAAIRAQPPVYGADLENVAVTGAGVLDGAGQGWRPVKKNKVTAAEWKQLIASGGVLNENNDTWYPTARALKGSLLKRPGVIAEGYDLSKAEEIKEFLRPNMVSLIRCKRVLLQGVTFQNSPAWCLHPLLSEHVVIRGVTVRNPWNAQNGDGVDVESCRYVLIEDSMFDVGDDGICIKSGRDEEGRKRGVPTQDVIVRNCTVYHGHGGFVVGSEMSGGVRNVFVYNCNFLGTDIGIRFKTTRGRGGVVENITLKKIRMNNIGGAAILFDMYYMAKDPLAIFSGADAPAIEFQPVTEATPQIKNVQIEDVVCKGAETAIFVRGLPEMNVREIRMNDIRIQSKAGLVCIEGDGITLRNAILHCDEAIVAQLQNSKNITFDDVQYKPGQVFLRVTGNRSKNVRLLNANVKKGAMPYELSAEVSKNVISFQ